MGLTKLDSAQMLLVLLKMRRKTTSSRRCLSNIPDDLEKIAFVIDIQIPLVFTSAYTHSSARNLMGFAAQPQGKHEQNDSTPKRLRFIGIKFQPSS
jgi:hypothetical protein